MNLCYMDSKAYRLETHLCNTQTTCQGPEKPMTVFEWNQAVSQNPSEWPEKYG